MRFQTDKFVLDEWFASSEFVPGVEAGVEFRLMDSASTNSMTAAVSAIPASHQLNTASTFVGSGVDLNVVGTVWRLPC